MPAYQKTFDLDTTDIDIIEHALRNEIARHATLDPQTRASDAERAAVRALNRVLGKLHNQKVFYAQVKLPGVPAG